MSILDMRRKFSRHMRIGMLIFAVLFVGSVVLMAVGSGPQLNGRSQAEDAATADAQQVVATVGKEKITRQDLEGSYSTLFSNVAGSGTGVPLSYVLMLRMQALQSLGQSAMLAQEARNRGIRVTDSDIEASIVQNADAVIKDIQASTKSRGGDPRLIYRAVMAKNGESRAQVNETEFRDWLTNTYFPTDRNNLERTLLLNGLQNQVVEKIKVTDADLMASFEEVNLKRIVVGFMGGARTEAAAKQKIEKAYAALKSGGKFDAVGEKHSDLPQTMLNATWQSKGRLSQLFGEKDTATIFSLKTGEFSAPIKTQSLYAIFQVMGTRNQAPKDLAKSKDTQIKQLLAQRRQEAWTKFMTDLNTKTKLEPKSAEATALLAFSENTGKEADVITKFEKAMGEQRVMPGEVYSAISYTIGQYYLGKKDYVKAKDRFEAALSGSGSTEKQLTDFPGVIYLALGDLARAQKNDKDALANYQQASDSTIVDQNIHMSLYNTYEKMGLKDKAAAEKKWLEEFNQEQQRAQKQMEDAQKAAEAAAKGAAAQPAPKGSAVPTPPANQPKELGK